MSQASAELGQQNLSRETPHVFETQSPGDVYVSERRAHYSGGYSKTPRKQTNRPFGVFAKFGAKLLLSYAMIVIIHADNDIRTARQGEKSSPIFRRAPARNVFRVSYGRPVRFGIILMCSEDRAYAFLSQRVRVHKS